MENTNNKDSRRKTIILTTIGLITLISLVIGAAYAYLNVTGTNSSTPTNVTGSTEGLGGAALSNPTPKLHINLQATDMNAANKGTSYYATNDESKNYDTEETKRSIAIASVSGGQADTKNQCESTLTIDISGSMKDELVSGDGKIVLSPTNGVEIDITEIDLKDLADKTSITIPVVYKITGSTEEKIEAIMLINNTENDQIKLAGKEININITNTSFKCEVVNEFSNGMTVADLIASNPTNLNATTIAEDELGYRYQGSATQVTNNYICFGTTSKEECINNQDKNMYRIIGITKNGKMKLIKKSELPDRMQWYSDSKLDISWPESDIFKGLNGINGGQYNNMFIENKIYLPDGWENKIYQCDWKYGDTEAYNITAKQMLQIEQKWTMTTSAKIGLMYASDYYYAYQKEGLNCTMAGGDSEVCFTSWLDLHNNSSSTSSDEYTMSRYGIYNGNYQVLFPVVRGRVYYYSLTSKYKVRPVFYLTSDTIIKSGTGNIDDPYMIKL